MRDFGPLPECPSGKNGRHLSVLMPMGEHVESGPLFAVWSCGNCGTTRVVRVDAEDRPLDDRTADEILQWARR